MVSRPFWGEILLKEDVPNVRGRTMVACDIREKGLLVLFLCGGQGIGSVP